MIKGTRYLLGAEATAMNDMIASFRTRLLEKNFLELIIPSIYETRPWVERSGTEIESQLWCFKDKGGRDVTLIPEATAVIIDLYNNGWKQSMPKPIRVMTVSRIFRYEQPQKGRYREFTQFNVEILGPGDYEAECRSVMKELLDMSGVQYEFDDAVKRGLSYYQADGFEARCENLGAQKQVGGGGKYRDGCGFALGIDRIMLSKELQQS